MIFSEGDIILDKPDTTGSLLPIMTTRVKKRLVTLTADAAVEIEPGTLLPPGRYAAVEKRLGVALMGGNVEWTKPEYLLELTEEQITAMGGKPNPNLISAEYDVSKFVRSGQLKII